MFYLQLALLHEEYNSGRMDFETYQSNIILVALDHERLKMLEYPVAIAA